MHPERVVRLAHLLLVIVTGRLLSADLPVATALLGGWLEMVRGSLGHLSGAGSAEATASIKARVNGPSCTEQYKTLYHRYSGYQKRALAGHRTDQHASLPAQAGNNEYIALMRRHGLAGPYPHLRLLPYLEELRASTALLSHA